MPIFNPTTITGTANQVLANGNSGSVESGLVTLTLPQNIGTTSSPSFTGLSLSSLTANSFLYSGAGGALTSTLAPTNGQLLIGSTGAAPVRSTLTAGTAISVTNGAGSITINNTGVTSTTAGSGISVSGSTGAVTITNTGVLSFSAGTTGLTPNTSTTGAVTLAGTLLATNGGTGQSTYVVGDILYANTTTTLARLADVATGNSLISGGIGVAPTWGKIGLTTHVSGTLGITNGGTGLTSTPTNGQLLIGNGTGYTLSTITQGTGISVTNGSGTITISNTGVTSVAASGGTTGLTFTGSPITTTGTLTLGGTLSVANGGTGLTATPANGQIDIGNGTGFTRTTLTAGTGISITNGAGSVSIANSNNAPGDQHAGRIYFVNVGAVSGTTQFAADVTPTTTSGWLLTTSPTITPTTTSSRFIVDFSAFVDVSSNNRDFSIAVFRGTTLVGYQVATITTSGRPQTVRIYVVDTPVTTTPFTYTLRVGMNAAGTSYVNQSIAADVTNTGNSSFTITELY